MTAADIAKLTGRELDAAIHERLFGFAHDFPVCGWMVHGLPDAWQQTHPNCRGLAAMIDKMRDRGWKFHIVEQDNGTILVILNGRSRVWPTAFGTTLPEAFARAALLTTLEM